MPWRQGMEQGSDGGLATEKSICIGRVAKASFGGVVGGGGGEFDVA